MQTFEIEDWINNPTVRVVKMKNLYDLELLADILRKPIMLKKKQYKSTHGIIYTVMNYYIFDGSTIYNYEYEIKEEVLPWIRR